MTALYPWNICIVIHETFAMSDIKGSRSSSSNKIHHLLHYLTGSESKGYREPLLTVKIKLTFEVMVKLVVKTYPTVCCCF